MTNGILCSFARVERSHPCPICERPDWCLIGIAGTEFEGDTICQRVESDRRFGDAGFLHRGGDKRSRPGPLRRFFATIRAIDDPKLDTLARRAKCCADLRELELLASHLNLDIVSFLRLEVGRITERLANEHGIPWAKGAWTFPMRSAEGKVVGIRLRMDDGSKRAVPGSHDGLFIPKNLGDLDQLLICEGPTDTAAMFDLGFAAIGRPSCRGGKRELVHFVRSRKPRRVVIVADSDDSGRVGAHDLAFSLVTRVPELRVVTPPASIKDSRDWKRAGATAAVVQGVIDATPARRVSIRIGSRER